MTTTTTAPLMVYVEDTTDRRRPILGLRCDNVRPCGGQLEVSGITAVIGAGIQNSTEGNDLANERAEDFARIAHLNGGFLGFSRPDWALVGAYPYAD